MLSRLLILSCLAASLSAQVAVRRDPAERQVLTNLYFAEGACAGDFDGDGRTDLASGPFWYRGPGFVQRHAIYTPQPFSIVSYADAFIQFAEDIDEDGATDLVIIGFPGTPAHWYRNPGNGQGTWAKHSIWPTVGMEAATMVDIDRDGRRELLCSSAGQLVRLVRDPNNPTAPWRLHRVSPIRGFGQFTHGLGIGDLNGDGRDDILLSFGWFEQPPSLAGDPPWTPHWFDFGPGGAQMYGVDIDGDGDQDVVSSRSAHTFGLDWYENTGSPTVFVRHTILPDVARPNDPRQFSQLHALGVADFDGDGVQDLITGKTWLAHNGGDPEWWRAPVVDVFLTRRRANGVQFDSLRLSTEAGIGRQVVVADLDGDGVPDVATANKRGVSVFRFRR